MSFRVQISSPLVLLQQRTWLIHWSLFVFFNHPKGRDLIIDMFLYSPQYVLKLTARLHDVKIYYYIHCTGKRLLSTYYQIRIIKEHTSAQTKPGICCNNAL